MSKMYTGTGRLFQEVQNLPLDDEALRDIERRIKIQPHFLGEPLVVVGEAFDFPQIVPHHSHNLIALDAAGRTVVINLGMGVADADKSLQALQLAAHLATLAPEDIGKIARSFIGRPANDTLRRSWEEKEVEMSDEAVELSSLLAASFARDAEDYADLINASQRILITCEAFTSRLVGVIQWLVNSGSNVTGIRYSRFLVGGQEIYSAEQVVPRIDPAVDAPEQNNGAKAPEAAEPWRMKGRLYHMERLTPALSTLMDRLLVLLRESIFTIHWSNKYYFWVRGERRNLRVRTYYRDRIEIGFYNAAPKAVEAHLAEYGISAEVSVVGGYGDSPFISLTGEMELTEAWLAMLHAWLGGPRENGKTAEE